MSFVQNLSFFSGYLSLSLSDNEFLHRIVVLERREQDWDQLGLLWILVHLPPCCDVHKQKCGRDEGTVARGNRTSSWLCYLMNKQFAGNFRLIIILSISPDSNFVMNKEFDVYISY